MELLVWNQDRTQEDIDATGGYAFTKGDVAEINPDGYAWGELVIADPRFVIIQSQILPTHAEALLMTRFYSPTRQREYYVAIDSLDLTKPVPQAALIANSLHK
jgi:hypothetical protein